VRRDKSDPVSLHLKFYFKALLPEWANFRLFGDCIQWPVTQVAQIVGAIFTFKVIHKIGLHFGPLITNSSGHPVYNAVKFITVCLLKILSVSLHMWL
jgi:hypothetical protein